MKCYLNLEIYSINHVYNVFVVCKLGTTDIPYKEISIDQPLIEQAKTLAFKIAKYSKGWFEPKLYSAEIKDGDLHLYFSQCVPYEPATLNDGYEYRSISDLGIARESAIRSRVNYEF